MKMGKVSLKTIIVMVILILVGILGVLMMNNIKSIFSGASAGADPKGVLATSGSDGKTAVITWNTEKPVQGVVLYGASPAALLLSAPETESATDHSVKLTSLRADQVYYFRIEVGEEMFDNSGIPWSFKTSGNKTLPTPTSGSEPTLAVTRAPETGGCNHTTDYNHDGVINSIDYINCVKSGGGEAKTPTGTASACNHTTDYNHDGIVNTIDYVNCVKNSNKAAVTPTVAR